MENPKMDARRRPGNSAAAPRGVRAARPGDDGSPGSPPASREPRGAPADLPAARQRAPRSTFPAYPLSGFPPRRRTRSTIPGPRL